MSSTLTPGANAPLPTAASVSVRLSASGQHADLIALLLDPAGKADGDDGVVLFSHPVSAGGAVKLDQGADTVTLDMNALPSQIERVLIVAQADGAPDLSGAGQLTATVTADGGEVANASFPASSFPTLQLAELYRRNDAWKVRALGDGYADGLAKLLTVHGVDVSDDAPAAPEPAPAAAAPAAPKVSFEKVSGKVDLKKGAKPVLMEKTPLITATVSWPAHTDYDVYALVMTTDGQQVDVAAFGAAGVPAQMSYKGIRHTGDVQRGGGQMATEVIEIKLTPDILAVVPVAYSAQSNGTGSFRRYAVSLAIDNKAGTEITIDASHANDDDNVYTCVPGMIRNSPEGVIIEPLELYSARNSENRPALRWAGDTVDVVMDAGPRNDYK